MSSTIDRARLLREHRRHEEAVAALHQYISGEPDDAQAHVELALNRLEMPGQRALALDDVRRAVALEPDNAFFQALHAQVLSQLDQHGAALPIADQSIAMDPENDYAWYVKAVALTGLSRWKEAEDALRQSLELDPDDVSASNLLSHVLRMQNRLDESERETSRRLARDPENAFSLANAGWAALQRHKPAEAENLFRESLRIDPELDYAREGLKESFRARSAFYRLFLRWAFFMQQFSEKNQFWIIIGIVFAFRMIRKAAVAIHPALLIPLFFLFYVFIFGTWLSTGIANLMILRDPSARLSLDRREKLEGIIVGGGFVVGFLSGIAGFPAEMPLLTLAGAVMMLGAIPCSMVLGNVSRLGRVVFGIGTLLVYLLGAAGMGFFIKTPGATLMDGGGAALAGPLIATAILSWLGMVKALRKPETES